MSLAAAALWSLAFVFATERFGDKFAPAANRLAEAAASLAHTAKNGPAQPWLAQAFFGRRCATAMLPRPAAPRHCTSRWVLAEVVQRLDEPGVPQRCGLAACPLPC